MFVALIFVLAILLYVIHLYLCGRYFIQPETPPKAVRMAGMTEAAFGVLVLAPMWFIHDNRLLLVMVQFLCLFWIIVAISLYKGSKLGRKLCLILSILRLPTIIGIPFSFFSLYKLYFVQESKEFFDKQQKEYMDK